jgi:thiol-disulfide isomerase/thioredoxin
MPDFVGISRWWNTPGDTQLTPEDLKGKVVLVDFWTYSCINCIRTQPVLRAWWKAYEDKGLVIVGVHTPEFAFEKDAGNVEKALRKADLRYPIALDADYGTWNTYANRYWPAAYLFDRQGRLRYTHFGEGEYDVTEGAIRELLAEGGMALEQPTGADSTPNMEMIKTAETYFGSARIRGLENLDEFKAGEPVTYTIRQPKPNFWSVGGQWSFEEERAVALGTKTTFRMNVNANAAHIVLGSTDGKAKYVQVLIDGITPTDEQLTDDLKRTHYGGAEILVQGMDLYRVARFPEGGEHTIELTFQDANVALYAATFGE